MTSGNYAPYPGQYGAPTGKPAGALVRWFARFIDGIIVGLASWALAFFTDNLSSIWVTGLFTGLLTFVYFFVLETTTGSTLGKKLLGLRVVGPGGVAKPTAAQAAIRNSWTLLPIIPFVGGLLGIIAIFIIGVTISGSATKQGKHDQLAGGTLVVKG
ncbi:RDD family protein [Mycolicibacterium phlei]|uniref:RDD family protein n=1 Tax=Mycolicibacterium phlei TaxID=1771 RepID=UPI00025AF4E4|nr:RDD family protein [Mycolicibacterium phlei]EID15401.1 hypothetical protein MPHLEI_08684 [Mycolicibacterium phlei RIVM601174]MBF4190988.1 hypothetical protein [Mycolicibacterium phlei]